MSAWIRLGHKYHIDKLVQDGLDYLRRFYPDLAPGAVIPRNRPEEFTRLSAIGVVNLARLTKSNDLLPLSLARWAHSALTPLSVVHCQHSRLFSILSLARFRPIRVIIRAR